MGELSFSDGYFSQNYFIHPALLDCCLQASLLFFLEKDFGNPYLPVRFESLKIYQSLGKQIWSYVQDREQEKQSDPLQKDIYLLNEQGQVLVEILGFEFKKLANKVLGKENKDLYYQLVWKNKKLPNLSVSESPLAKKKGKWLLFQDRLSVGESLAQLLK